MQVINFSLSVPPYLRCLPVFKTRLSCRLAGITDTAVYEIVVSVLAVFVGKHWNHLISHVLTEMGKETAVAPVVIGKEVRLVGIRMQTDGYLVFVAATAAILAEDIQIVIHRVTKADDTRPTVMVLTVTDFGNGSIALCRTTDAFSLYFKETMEVREIKVRQIMCAVT